MTKNENQYHKSTTSNKMKIENAMSNKRKVTTGHLHGFDYEKKV